MSYLHACMYILHIIMTYMICIGVAVTRGNVAAVAGGVIGGIVALLLIILGAIVLLIVLRRMGKGEFRMTIIYIRNTTFFTESIRLKSNDSMDTFNVGFSCIVSVHYVHGFY